LYESKANCSRRNRFAASNNALGSRPHIAGRHFGTLCALAEHITRAFQAARMPRTSISNPAHFSPTAACRKLSFCRPNSLYCNLLTLGVKMFARWRGSPEQDRFVNFLFASTSVQAPKRHSNNLILPFPLSVDICSWLWHADTK
jgi:hypothetical protein